MFQPREIETYSDLIEAAVRRAGAFPYRKVRPTGFAYADRQRRDGDTALREKLYEIQNGACGICSGILGGPYSSNLDHVMPRAKGGKDYRNRVLAHVDCNTKKSDRLPTGCELIFLDAVNARLHSESLDPASKIG